MEFTNASNLEEAERVEKFKAKVLKFVLYKKRTESEVRKKFEQDPDSKYLDDVIENLKQYNYLGDDDYIARSLAEFKNLKNLSIKEVRYKLMQKDIDKTILEDYMEEHKEELLEYEINSAKNIISKKIRDKDLRDIKEFLFQKGYTRESIESAIQEFEAEQ